MILTRKILLPALVLFGILLIGVSTYVFITYETSIDEEQQRYLALLNNGFDSEIAAQQATALSLAQEIANNAAIQDAYARQDRPALLALATPIFQRLGKFNITEMHFEIPPATSFLRVQDPTVFGDDLSAYRPLVLNVNTNQQPLVGFEIGKGGLAVRAIVPVSQQGHYVGALELAISAGQPLLTELTAKYGNEWNILLTQEAVLKADANSLPNYRGTPAQNLLLFASSTRSTVFSDARAYDAALLGEPTITRLNTNGRTYAIFSRPLIDNFGRTFGVLDIVADRSALVARQNGRLLTGALTLLLALGVGGLGITLITTRALRPIGELTAVADALARGNFTSQAAIESNDEIGELSHAINALSSQVRESIGTLEQRVQERTSALERRTLELETISEVVREIAIIRDLDTLLNVSVNLIRERFGYYHTAIFLTDERGEFAILRAASGAGAQKLLEERFKRRISDVGLLQSVLRGGQTHLAGDLETDALLGRRPLLAGTVSEVMLPLQVFNVTLGALDIHGTQAGQFAQSDIQTLKLLADQLAAAIENAQLVQQVEGTVGQLNKAYRTQTQQAWQSTIEQQIASGYEYDGRYIRPIPANMPSDLIDELERGRPVVLQEPHGGNGMLRNTLLLPLTVLGQLIGVVGLEAEEPGHIWTEEELAVAQAAANRAALTLENARLLEESQRRALKERAISEATARIGSALDIENILQNTVEEVERVLGNSEVVLQITTDTPRRGEGAKPFQGNVPQ